MADAKRSKRFCAVPGCGLTLSKHNRMGVCQVHNHAPGLCQCTKCGGTGVSRAAPVAREGVRSVVVPRFSSIAFEGERTLRVSLPCEPWLKGGVHDRR
jgi:hypothetical protein